MTFELIVALFALLLTLTGYGFYYSSIFRKKTKPHFFTWFNWTIMGVVVTYAQWRLNADYAAWVCGLVTLLTLGLSLLSLFYGEKNITRSDWVMFVFIFLLIPVWIVTHQPLAAIILSIVIHLGSFYPTIRKSWSKPCEEDSRIYTISGMRDVFTLMAVPIDAIGALVYPAYMVLSNLGFALYLYYRRKCVGVPFKEKGTVL